MVDRWVGDAGRFQQILVNLISNAIKFTHHGGIFVRALIVHPEGEGKDSRVRLEVRDTGIGIAASIKERVFDTFVQADVSTTRKFGGTGLGLSISKKLAEMMNGTIDFESREGHGTCFWIEIPLAAALPDRVVSLDSVRTQKELVHARPKGHRILVAEDNPVNQLVIRKVLEHLGHEVVIAGNGEEALAELGVRTFDLVLMDCQMPKMDGFEATRRIRAKEDPVLRAIPIVAVTADAIQENREACRRAGMSEYLPKPLRAAELEACIRKLCG